MTELPDITLVAGGAAPSGVVSRVVDLAVLETLAIAAATRGDAGSGAVQTAQDTLSEHQT